MLLESKSLVQGPNKKLFKKKKKKKKWCVADIISMLDSKKWGEEGSSAKFKDAKLFLSLYIQATSAT